MQTVHDHAPAFGVRLTCAAVGIAPATFYRHRPHRTPPVSGVTTRPVSPRALAPAERQRGSTCCTRRARTPRHRVEPALELGYHAAQGAGEMDVLFTLRPARCLQSLRRRLARRPERVRHARRTADGHELRAATDSHGHVRRYSLGKVVTRRLRSRGFPRELRVVDRSDVERVEGHARASLRLKRGPVVMLVPVTYAVLRKQ
jgi:hypothetical protein